MLILDFLGCLYAHHQESFEDRPYWKEWTFKEKLKNLDNTFCY
ncbi:hypothetical protein HMPREF0083_02629 [Aneurinibacillus aneurinilyticus ATCC 12856]|uniref:Uncharacterized protein n=1 Tax=Aneurinibacillus aneurinilyticus ATCC 12856 TaxID=649747 RepID=U1X310_ANEAE|nr:hypothetical protein HMPREF0083_02629 [Aneurinibacillus aneurinilyticus ATCC 12856]